MNKEHNIVDASVTRPIRCHSSGCVSRTIIACAAGNDACAGKPRRAAVMSGPPNASSSACACGSIEVSCATGAFGRASGELLPAKSWACIE
jgi:hypothetical protein